MTTTRTTDETTDRVLPRVMLRRELIAAGWRDRGIATMVRHGDWTRIRTGAYVESSRWNDLGKVDKHRTRARAVLAQAKTELVFSHTTGLCELGIEPWDLSLDQVHVTRPDGRAGRAEAGVRQHCGVVGPLDTQVTTGVTTMVPARIGLEITMIADLEHGLVAMNQILHAGLAEKAEVAALAGRMQHWPSSLTTDLVVRLSDGRCESVGESRTAYLCWNAGIPMPVPQHEVTDADGRVVAVVDFAWPEHGVFLEFDGKVKYTSLLKPGESAADVLLKERARERLVMELTGWRCIRLTWADLHDPARTARRIRQVLGMA